MDEREQIRQEALELLRGAFSPHPVKSGWIDDGDKLTWDIELPDGQVKGGTVLFSAVANRADFKGSLRSWSLDLKREGYTLDPAPNLPD
jgi:hypothetical protein